MKNIKAFIQHHVLPLVVRSLHEMPNFPGLTVVEVLGQDRGRGAGGSFELTEENLCFHHKKMIEIFADDALVKEIVDRIVAAAHTGTDGDGLVSVAAVESVVRIRSGEQLTH